MRMRKKKHLEDKLTECSNLIEMTPVTMDYRREIEDKSYLNFSELFGNNNPVELEIGCGKGQFICELAKRNPNINYLAVEVDRSVISMACHKALDEGVTNVIFFRCKAEVLQKYLRPGSVRMIYLNFSCPFPKSTYANRRLTYIRFLEIYKEILAPGGEIHQKTDNMHFFEFSLEQFALAGYKLKNISLDLHHSDYSGNIITEYEKKFSEQGFRIYRLEAYR